jgi:serine/threonine protein kinase
MRAVGTSALAPGQLVAGRFRVERLAGAGGMGEVHRAIDEQSGRAVALKVTRESVEDEARFLREAVLLESLVDPGIVAYHGHGRLADGRPFLAMEWLEGESLADRLARGPLEVPEALSIVRAVARALGAAHRRGIVHRDVKPSNVFLCTDAAEGPRVRLIDFGIARHTRLRGQTVTKTDAAIGTPYYMAPEQVRGARDVGPAADVFSLGCLLYECLTGRSPFHNETVLAALASVLLEDPVPLRRLVPAVSGDLERMALLLLAKDATVRPPDGDSVVAELDRLGAPDGTLDERASRTPHTLPGLSRREQRLALVLVALPAQERRAVEATQRADEPDPTSLRLRTIVERSEGRIEVSAEGALVASFSDDGATRDRVERAVRCARSMLASDPGARIALVAGRTVSGRVPVGEVVERALGLARSLRAGDGGLALDDDVAAFASSVPLAQRGAPNGTRLFGRDRELGALRGAIDEALDEPVARVLVVQGEAGVGKTRLLDELAARVGDARPGARVLRVRSQWMDRESPLALAVRLVRAASAIEEGEPIATRREKLSAHVASLRPGHDAARLLRDLGDLARVPGRDEPTDEVLRGDSFLRGDLERRAFLDWLALLARTSPTVLAVDDGHHADVTSLELLAEAAHALPDRPLVIALTARLDDRGGRSVVERAFERAEPETHRLGRLLQRAARALVDDLLGPAEGPDAVPDEVRAGIVARGEGNPFFLRELSAARARGAEAPASILAAIEERILRAPEETRRALRAIALLREPSTLEALHALVPALEPDELRGRVDELSRAELVELETGPDGRVRARPRSALVADAAYAMIPDDERAAAHEQAGLRLREEGAEPARVAFHLERGSAPLAAAAAFRDASERALEAHDLARAEAHAARGLELAGPGPSVLVGELTLCRAQAARWSGDYAHAFQRAEEALACFEPRRTESPELARRWLETLGLWLAAASALGRGEPLARAETLLFVADGALESDRGLRALETITLCRGAAARLGRGERAQADAWLARAVERAGPSPASIASAWLHALSASRALHDGDLGTFLADTARAVEEYERADDARNACNQRVRLANALVSVGELAQAEPLLVRARDEAQRMGLSLIAGYAVQNLGHVRARLGRSAEAWETLEDAVARGTRLGDAHLVAGARLYLALLAVGSQPERALEEAASAVRALASEGPFRAVARAILARAALATGDRALARSEAEAASAWLSEHGPIEEGEAAIHRARLEVLLDAGDEAGARAVATRATEALERRAGQLPEELRRGFLEHHPDHVRLREVAARAPSPRE